MQILMVAAENGSLPGGKVGGMGDVLRDVPRALARAGQQVTVITPSYDHFCHLPGAQQRSELKVDFCAGQESLGVYLLAAADPQVPGLEQWVLEHPLQSACGVGQIYCDDPPERPFATDASKFALFCAGVAEALRSGALPRPEIIHLHDWHAALLALLLRGDPRYAEFAEIPLVYTIHNLAMQGIRPLAGDPSSLQSWFPGLALTQPWLRDPRYPDCWNPVRAAINLCNKVHAVSPTYAREICDPATGSDAGLLEDLQRARDTRRLVGILNGCEYPDSQTPVQPFTDFLRMARRELSLWIGRSQAVAGSDVLTLRTLDQWIAEQRERPGVVVTSVGRLTEQKFALLSLQREDGRSVLEHLLDELGEDGLLLILGNGSPKLETMVGELAARRENLLLLRGFSNALAEQLYAGGDLFLMPSSFEPCGISQMLAMRAGQPCLVHAVGGLADTVQDGVNGFSFAGASDSDRAAALLNRFAQALAQLRGDPLKTARMREAAAAERFLWDDAADAYVDRLYTAARKSDALQSSAALTRV